MQGSLETAPVLAQCEWDSRCFGFKVAELREAELDEKRLEELLETARADGIRLVYWRASARTVVDEALLKRFGGSLVDRKVTYERTLGIGQIDATHEPTSGVLVEPLPMGPAEPGLVDLAIGAGEHSRFSTDPRFPPEQFQKLFRTWIERSAMREIAEIVLVASTDLARHAGMVTGSIDGTQASIGLIAVAAGLRGRGIGKALMNAAHQWMATRGATRCEVVSQQANRPACKLYEQMGYRVEGMTHVYHFWPTDASNDAKGGA